LHSRYIYRGRAKAVRHQSRHHHAIKLTCTAALRCLCASMHPNL
jgi:hypothetical protein